MSKSTLTGSVIILANEDDAVRTIRPRLDASGGDTRKVHIVEGVVRDSQRPICSSSTPMWRTFALVHRKSVTFA